MNDVKWNTLIVKKINLLDLNFQDDGDTYFLNDQLACRLNTILVDLFLTHP